MNNVYRTSVLKFIDWQLSGVYNLRMRILSYAEETVQLNLVN